MLTLEHGFCMLGHLNHTVVSFLQQQQWKHSTTAPKLRTLLGNTIVSCGTASGVWPLHAVTRTMLQWVFTKNKKHNYRCARKTGTPLGAQFWVVALPLQHCNTSGNTALSCSTASGVCCLHAVTRIPLQWVFGSKNTNTSYQTGTLPGTKFRVIVLAHWSVSIPREYTVQLQ